MKTIQEWFDFYNNRDGYHKLNFGVALEQAYRHSIKEKYCAECSSTENIVKQPESNWVKSEYYLCGNCHNYYKNKKELNENKDM